MIESISPTHNWRNSSQRRGYSSFEY